MGFVTYKLSHTADCILLNLGTKCTLCKIAAFYTFAFSYFPFVL